MTTFYLRIRICGDDRGEANESVIIVLTPPSGTDQIGDFEATLTIRNDDVLTGRPIGR